MEESDSTGSPAYVPLLQGIRAAKSIEFLQATTPECIRDKSQQESLTAITAANAISTNFTEFADCPTSKYKHFYSDLLACYRFLEQENAKLLQLIRAKQKPTSPPRCIEKLLDEFAFKVATSKDTHERLAIKESGSEGRQAFMAKRWKARYYILLDLTESYLNLLKTQSNLEICDSPSRERKENLRRLKDVLRGLTEVMGPWIVDKPHHDSPGLPVKDLSCGEQPGSGNNSYSEYAENDFVVPLSSVFLIDLLANHKLCSQRIKQQLDVKPQIMHVLRKEKERRNQMKQQCAHLSDEIAALEKSYEAACARLQELESAHQQEAGNPSPKTPTATFYSRERDAGGDEQHQLEDVDDYDFDGIDRDEEGDETPSEVDMLMSDSSALDVRIREVQSALKEEEAQQASILKRLQRVTGTVHAFVRLHNEEPRSCHLDVISHNKLLINNNNCFILDGIYSASEGNQKLYGGVSTLIVNCLSGHPTSLISLGPRSEELLFSPKDGLALLSITNLIELMNLRTESEFFLYAYALVFTDKGVVNLTKDHPSGSEIDSEHGDPSFIEPGARCLRIDSSRVFGGFLSWLDTQRQDRPTGQLAVAVRLVGVNRHLKSLTHSSWVGFMPLISTAERDSLGRIFLALRRRARPNFQETAFAQLLQKLLFGLSRTTFILNVDFDHDNLPCTMADLQFANEAVKATTETADMTGAKPVIPA